MQPPMQVAEGFNLGGMVVRLVLEHEKPVLRFAVHSRGDVDGAGVDLLALIEICEISALFERFCANGCHIHKCLGTDGSLLLAVYLNAGSQIAFVGGFRFFIQNLHVVDVRGERGVAAGVRPVGIDHANLSDGGVTVFDVAEMCLQEFQIIQIHRKSKLVQKRGQPSLVKGCEARYSLDSGWNVILHLQRLCLFQGRLARFDGVDNIALDHVNVSGCDRTGEQIYLCRTDSRSLALRHQLNTGAGGVRTLVKLSGQILYRKRHIVAGRQRCSSRVYLRLRKHGLHCPVESRLIQTFNIVAVDKPQTGQICQSKQ